MDQYGWKSTDGGFVIVSNQEEIIKTRNITEKIDVESVAMLQEALKNFRGGYAVVTHSQSFVDSVCDETWTVSDGQVSGAKRIWGKAKNREATSGGYGSGL